MMRDRGVPDILLDLMREFTQLFRSEIRLAGAEVSEKVSVVGVALGLVVGGAVLLMAALVLMLQAAVAGLVAEGFSIAVATLIVGGIVLVVGAVLVWLGINRLNARNLTPKRTLEQLQRDAALAKHEVGAT
jgi:hypothetical protein